MILTLKQLVKFDQFVRNTDYNFLWNFSNWLSKRYLKKLLKKKTRNEIILNNQEDIWLLVQHSDNNPVLQNEYLSIFKVLNCNLDYTAYLEDRVLVNFYGYQLYGTQWTQEGLEYLLYPIKGMSEVNTLNSYDKQALNLRRKRMNLESIEDYTKILIDYPYFTNFNYYKNELGNSK